MYDNTNRGTLGKNKNPKSDKSPPYRGKINIEGKDYWLSAWVKESEGEKFFSLAATPKDDQPARQDPRGGGDAFEDSEIPFGPDK